MPGSSVLRYLLKFSQIHVHWISDAIEPCHPCHPLLLLSSIFFQHLSFFPMSQIFTSGAQSIGASTSASVLPVNVLGWFPLGLTGLLSLSPRNSQESSPAPQFESINFSVLSLLYGPTLTSVCDYWKNHSFDYMDLCHWQSDVSDC